MPLVVSSQHVRFHQTGKGDSPGNYPQMCVRMCVPGCVCAFLSLQIPWEELLLLSEHNTEGWSHLINQPGFLVFPLLPYTCSLRCGSDKSINT